MRAKSLLIGAVVLTAFTSCQTTLYKSATTQSVTNPVRAEVVADLDVSPTKISYTLKPSKQVLRGGYHNVLNHAVREALEKNGGGDVLVELQVSCEYKSFFLSKQVSSMTVSGYPAVYKNFRPAN